MMTRSCGGILAHESSGRTVLFRENPKSTSNFRWNRGIGFPDRDQSGVFSGWTGVKTFHEYATIIWLRT
jgi:hypothetical protein